MVVGWIDARIDTSKILGLQLRDARTIGNACGVITDPFIGSLCLSQGFLGTTEFVLLHRTDCGLMGATEDN